MRSATAFSVSILCALSGSACADDASIGGTGGRAGSSGSGAQPSSGGTAGSASGGVAGAAGTAGSAPGGAAGSSGAGSGGGGGTNAGTGPRFIGRFDQTDPEVPRFAWSGSAIELRFEGSQISVSLEDAGNNWFEVILDGEASRFGTESGTNDYVLGADLDTGPHELLLYRRTEALWGVTAFHGFDVAGGAYLARSAAPERRLAIIGDSISAGYGNEGPDQYCGFTPETENHYVTYGAIAARELGAELHTTAWSGIGMYRNNNGTLDDTMPDFFPRALPEDADSTWNFGAFQPQAVLVNLGTNDFAGGDPGAAYEQAYTDFVGELRERYPEARFYLALGSGFSGGEGYLNGVIEARAAAGDTAIEIIEFDGANSEEGFGCDWHPSVAWHARMAGMLVDVLRADLGW